MLIMILGFSSEIAAATDDPNVAAHHTPWTQVFGSKQGGTAQLIAGPANSSGTFTGYDTSDDAKNDMTWDVVSGNIDVNISSTGSVSTADGKYAARAIINIAADSSSGSAVIRASRSDEQYICFTLVVNQTDAGGAVVLEDETGGEFLKKTYTARLDCTLAISPHESAPTAAGDEMKSGYGIALNGTAKISSNAPVSALAASGKAVAYFPEFEYDTYDRVLAIEQNAAATASDITFQVNPLDHYKGRIHFLPIWYPDGPYSVYATYMAAYTPGGELVWHGSDDVTISGSLFDDWSVTPARP